MCMEMCIDMHADTCAHTPMQADMRLRALGCQRSQQIEWIGLHMSSVWVTVGPRASVVFRSKSQEMMPLDLNVKSRPLGSVVGGMTHLGPALGGNIRSTAALPALS